MKFSQEAAPVRPIAPWRQRHGSIVQELPPAPTMWINKTTMKISTMAEPRPKSSPPAPSSSKKEEKEEDTWSTNDKQDLFFT